MRLRWHKWWLLALWASACVLNPHPDIPREFSHGDPNASGDGAGASNSGGSAGSGNGAPSGGAFPTSPGGANGGTGGHALDIEGGDAAGESGASEGGASEGGAAGADQLAPGPPK